MKNLVRSVYGAVLAGPLLWVPMTKADSMDAFLFADLTVPRLEARALNVSAASRWFAEPEVRLRPERSTVGEATYNYSLRFRPTSARESRSRARLESIDYQLDVEELKRPLSDILKRRYQTLLELAEREVEMALLTREVHLLRSLLDAEETLFSTGDVPASRLQRSLVEYRSANGALEQARAVLTRMRADTVGDLLRIPPESERAPLPFISPQQIAANLADLVPAIGAAGSAERATETTLARLEVERARERVELERSQSAFQINLLEMGFDDRITNRYNLTVGFQLPQRRSSGLRRRQAQLEVVQQRAALVSTLTGEALRLRARQIRWQVAAWHAAARDFDQQASATQGSDALLAATARLAGLGTVRTMSRTHVSVLRDYVDLLDQLGLLQKTPWRNYLMETSP